jgi:hypothetical protein
MKPEPIYKIGLRAHIDLGRDTQNGRGYRDFVKYMTHGDEFGRPMTISKLKIAFSRSRPTIEKWIKQYCAEKGIAMPERITSLMKSEVERENSSKQA